MLVYWPYCIWCSDSKPTYFGATNWAKSKFWNGYNSVILKDTIMKKSESFKKCLDFWEHIWCSDSKPTYFGAANWAKSKFSWKNGKLYFRFFSYLNCPVIYLQFVIFYNDSFTNDWVIAISKFWFWISLPHICWKLLQIDPKSEF